MITYCLSDIHGEYELLLKATEWIWNDAANSGGPFRGLARHQVIFCGDYIDRGHHSRETLRFLKRGIKDGLPWIVLMGNHDALMRDTIHHADAATPALMTWFNNGGMRTLCEYIEDPAARAAAFERGYPEADDVFDEELEEHVGFIKQMPLWYEDEHRLYVHAGVAAYGPDPWSIESQPSKVTLWVRTGEMDRNWPDPQDLTKVVVHGHTPGAKSIEGKRICIDGGAPYEDGALKVYRFDGPGPATKVASFAKGKLPVIHLSKESPAPWML